MVAPCSRYHRNGIYDPASKSILLWKSEKFRSRFLPLYQPQANQLAYALGLDVRREGWIIDQALEYCGLQLDLPFTKQITADMSLSLTAIKAYMCQGKRRLQSEKDYWSVLEQHPHKDMGTLDRFGFLKSFLLEDSNSSIYDIVEYEAVQAALDKPIAMNLRLSKILTQIAAGKMWIDQFSQLIEVKRAAFV